jgi:hypothetical protein
MNRGHFIAALVGALVVVGAYELTGGGKTHETGAADAPESAPGEDLRAVRAPTVAADGGAAQSGELERDRGGNLDALSREELLQHIDRLEQELDSVSTDRGLAENRVVALEGKPQPWPEDLPKGYSPEEFRATLTEALASQEGAELVDIDCSEYPCIAVLDLPTEGGPQAARSLADKLTESGFEGDSDLMVMIGQREDEEGSQTVAVLSAMPEGEAQVGATDRTNFRMRQAMGMDP